MADKRWFSIAQATKILVGVTVIAFTVAACGTTALSSAPQQSPESPLAEYMGGMNWDETSAEEMERQLQAQHMRTQELVAQCMREAGFDYHPVQAIIDVGGTPAGDFRPDDRDWVSQWGYGVVDTPAGGSGAVITWDDSMAPPDPNEEMLAEFSAAERGAWEQALRGELAGVFGVIPNDIPLENQGCLGWAENEILGREVLFPTDLLMTDEFAPLNEAIAQMRESLDQIPERLAIELDWSNCMADAGFPNFAAQPEARRSIIDRYIGRRLSEPARAELREREIPLALADLDCRTSTDYTARVDAVRIAIETQFVEDNLPALEAFRTAFEQRGVGTN